MQLPPPAPPDEPLGPARRPVRTLTETDGAVVVDGNHTLYRQAHQQNLGQLQTQAGVFTGWTYGFY